MFKFRLFFFIFFFVLPLGGLEAKAPPWVSEVPVPQGESLILLSKGIYNTRAQAEKVQGFIAQLMGSTPPDRVDSTDNYQGLPKGRYVVGTLFDSQVRANWWKNFSYRNRKLPKGKILTVALKGTSRLPYYPDAVRRGQKRLLTQAEAIGKVRELPDIQRLGRAKSLIFKITDFPRNGDLRYEVEVLEKRPGRIHRGHGVMVDFIMVSALPNAKRPITERLSQALRRGRP